MLDGERRHIFLRLPRIKPSESNNKVEKEGGTYAVVGPELQDLPRGYWDPRGRVPCSPAGEGALGLEQRIISYIQNKTGLKNTTKI